MNLIQCLISNKHNIQCLISNKHKPKEENKEEETIPELPDDVTKWSSAKKILPVLPNKFRASNQLLDDESDDSKDTPKKTGKHIGGSGNPSDDRFEGSEEKKAFKDVHKDRFSRRPSPMSTESHKSSSDGEDRRWMRRGGITGNGDLPLITISQASEGRDSPGQLSSLNSSEEGTPPSSATSRRRRPGLIPSVSEQDEDEYVEEEMSIEIQEHTHFEPIRSGEEEEAGLEEVTVQPEARDTAQIKSLTGCGAPRFRNIDESSSTDREDSTSGRPDDGIIRLGRRDYPSGRSCRQSSLQRSKAIVKGSDSIGSTDSNTLKPPSPEKRAKIQRLDTDSL